jgi:prepilin-type N-terminal cleavage/methylation domain-containing protein
MTGRERHPDRGFTLIEALLASVILSMAIIAITLPFTASVQQQQADARLSAAATLSQEMMEEVLSRSFDVEDEPNVPGPESGETRLTFDHYDDYDGLVEPAGQLRDAKGNLVDDPAAVGLSRHVSVAYVYVSGQSTSADPTFVRVVVEMRRGEETLVRITRLIYGGRS